MARPPKEDWVPLMRQTAVRRLKEGRDVKVMDIAEELGTSPALVHFYFGDRQHLIDEAWRQILWAFVDDDAGDVARFAEDRDWDGVATLVREILSEARDTTHSAHVRAAGEAVSSPDLRATLREVHEATIERWVDLLRASVGTGVIATPLDLDALATLFVAVPIGLAAVDPDMEPSRRAAVAQAYTAMLRAVLDADYSPHAAGGAPASAQA
jgi:AcrR family transcriptional regulator